MNPSDIRPFRELHGLSQAEFAPLLQVSREQLIRIEGGKSLPGPATWDRFINVRRQHTDAPSENPGAFRFIDLFAGIGGLRMGFEAAGGECVFTSEWNRFAQVTYQANFGTAHPIVGDITTIPKKEIPGHDLLLAGFPCQPFSIAGVSKKKSLGRKHGFADETQGTLFFDVAEILRLHRPRAFLLENVKNLVGHDRGRTMRVILDVLRRELGYEVTWKVLDAKGVVPQHRERIFLVGFDQATGFSFEDDVHLPGADGGPRMRSILHPEDGSQSAEEPYTEGSNARVAEKYTLSDRLWTYLQDYAEKHRKRGNGFGYGLVGPDDVARTLSARYYKDGSEILVAQPGSNPRRLTPRECARLMGFDLAGRSNRPPFVIPVSDTQAYKQFGNSVVVPVVEAIARGMAPYISDRTHVRSGTQFEIELRHVG